MVERLSPGLSAFWASVLMMVILVTQRPLFAFFRKDGQLGAACKSGVAQLLDGLITGARNMIGIGIATATAGIIVGAVSQTGVGSVLADLVEVMSFGNLLLMLLLTAVLSLILGMGLPTTANYIVVSSLLAPVIVTLGQESGLIVPLIAVHLFVFYFGIMADVTPPVGLASFAAAAVSGGDPIRTGFVAFFYSLRTAILPFLFIFNTDLLLINVDWPHGIMVFVISTIGILLFTAATQGYFLVRCRVHETLLLLLIAFSLFRPGFWMDRLVDPYEARDGAALLDEAVDIPSGTSLRLHVLGEEAIGNARNFVVLLPAGEGENTRDRLMDAGVELLDDNGKALVDAVTFDSRAEHAGLTFDQIIERVEIAQPQPPKELIFIPALLLLVPLVMMQRRRRGVEPQAGAARA
jgi:hypothetical protein